MGRRLLGVVLGFTVVATGCSGDATSSTDTTVAASGTEAAVDVAVEDVRIVVRSDRDTRLELPDGAVVFIPRGAVDRPVEMTLARSAAKLDPAEAGFVPLGNGYEFHTDGYRDFATPVHLTIPFDPGAVPDGFEGEVVALAREDSGEVVVLDGEVDLASGRLVVERSHNLLWIFPVIQVAVFMYGLLTFIGTADAPLYPYAWVTPLPGRGAVQISAANLTPGGRVSVEVTDPSGALVLLGRSEAYSDGEYSIGLHLRSDTEPGEYEVLVTDDQNNRTATASFTVDPTPEPTIDPAAEVAPPAGSDLERTVSISGFTPEAGFRAELVVPAPSFDVVWVTTAAVDPQGQAQFDIQLADDHPSGEYIVNVHDLATGEIGSGRFTHEASGVTDFVLSGTFAVWRSTVFFGEAPPGEVSPTETTEIEDVRFQFEVVRPTEPGVRHPGGFEVPLVDVTGGPIAGFVGYLGPIDFETLWGGAKDWLMIPDGRTLDYLESRQIEPELVDLHSPTAGTRLAWHYSASDELVWPVAPDDDVCDARETITVDVWFDARTGLRLREVIGTLTDVEECKDELPDIESTYRVWIFDLIETDFDLGVVLEPPDPIDPAEPVEAEYSVRVDDMGVCWFDPSVTPPDCAGGLFFGDAIDLDALVAVLGEPDDDGTVFAPTWGYYSAETLRFLDFDDLTLTFLDTSVFRDDGVMHLAAWTLFDWEHDGEVPYETIGGLGIGSTVAELQAVFGVDLVAEFDECNGGWFLITSDGPTMVLDGPPDDPATRVSLMYAGQSGAC